MARVFITGSAAGLGRAVAQTLLGDGHEVIVHARSPERLTAVNDLVGRAASAVVGDLADLDQTRAVADEVNQLGRVDAVIHNAGVYSGRQIMPVNVVAPYLLTALIDRPHRLVYLSSGMHRGGRADVAGVDWSGGHRTGSYSDSKLFVTTLAVAVARIWPDVYSNAVDPGWVPTRMGGPVLPTISGSGTSPKNGLPPVTNPRRAAAADTGITSGSAPRTRPPAIQTFKTACSRRWPASQPRR